LLSLSLSLSLFKESLPSPTPDMKHQRLMIS
jgi:hypothetical protein